MIRPGILCGALAATLVAVVWTWVGRPVAAPAAPATVAGFSFSPLQRGQDPARGELPTGRELDTDLALISAHTHRIRLYSVDGTLGHAPELARAYGIEVTAGVELDPPTSPQNEATNQTRLRTLLDIASADDNVNRVIVGNEEVLTADWTPTALGAVLDRLRIALDVPVSTAEPWHIWLAHPELADHVDFIAVHLLPYWEGVPVQAAVDFVAARMAELEARFPDKPILIAEVGWPTFGRARGAAVASPRNAALFARQFLEHAERAHYDYFLLEAFDQPWKRGDEGEVGAYWGIYDIDRNPKVDLWASGGHPGDSGPAALASLAAVLLVLAALLADGWRLRWPGRLLLTLVATLAVTAVVVVLVAQAQQYWTPVGALSATILLAGLLGVVLLLLVETHEWAEAQWSNRADEPDAPPAPAVWPKVSVHVPAYAEPPALLMDSLSALAALEYPNYEVIVVDNNTRDERLWRPVEAWCAQLGPRFRFFHVDNLPGFKAGALNFARRHTDDSAAIIAVIDSDYRVTPQWLSALVPHFQADDIAVVQAPQAYRDGTDSAFKAMCDAEYRGFFAIGMVTRNERNAIIQHGTMTMIRKRVLDEVGGWSEWTVTEDAELGLRVLEHGFRAVYVATPHGWGLTPDTFEDYKRQRFRWAYGAMQIVRRHWRALLGLTPTRLTVGQRFHYLAGWLGWLGDGVNLLFNVVAIGWSIGMIAAPLVVLPPLATFSAFVLALFCFKLGKIVALYKCRVSAGPLTTLAAITAGLALVHVVGRAILAGLRHGHEPFFRTPKLALRSTIASALAASFTEGALAVGLVGSAVGVAVTAPYPGIDRVLWCGLLATMAVPQLAAVATAVVSAVPERRRAARLDIRQPVPNVRRG
jgi:exo-beta-1,3-glucanase (GH17 family)/cellulose synthase/poly-beta-1,6-N-acetylglucosamine synthase-like glycosyltransferase